MNAIVAARAAVLGRSGASNWVLFSLLCLVWGSTWLSLKIGIATVPPITFSAARFLLAAIPLLGMAALRGRLRVPVATLLPASVLMIALNYGLMSWGMTRVPSGIAAVINLSTVPIATLMLCIAHRQASWSARGGIAIFIGAAGLAVLFLPRHGSAPMIAMAAIAAGAACYAWGGVLIRHRPATDAFALAGWQSLIGGVLLLGTAALTEPVSAGTLAALCRPVVLGNLVFLTAAAAIGGSVYLMLLAHWEAGRVATYAYVCPLIALAEGAVVTGRLPAGSELMAVALLLVATRFSLAG